MKDYDFRKIQKKNIRFGVVMRYKYQLQILILD